MCTELSARGWCGGPKAKNPSPPAKTAILVLKAGVPFDKTGVPAFNNRMSEGRPGIRDGNESRGAPALRARLRETLSHLTQGLSEKEVGAAMQLSRHTIHIYVKELYRLYHVNSRAELLCRVLRSDSKVGGSIVPPKSDARS